MNTAFSGTPRPPVAVRLAGGDGRESATAGKPDGYGLRPESKAVAPHIDVLREIARWTKTQKSTLNAWRWSR
jgi:hypothetical protein